MTSVDQGLLGQVEAVAQAALVDVGEAALQEHRIEDQLAQKWIRNYRPHPIRSEVWRYIDIDTAQRPK